MNNPASANLRPRRYFVDTSKGYVHVQDCGQGDNVIVFINITSFSAVLMRNVLSLMAARGYRAMTVDMMGYGLSDKKTYLWSMNDFADNAEEALALAGVSAKGFVCGHFAGLVGIELAARGRAGLKGLVVDGTPLISEEEQAKHVFGVAPPGVDWDPEGTHMVAFWKQASRLILRLNPGMELSPQPSNAFRDACLSYMGVVAYDPKVGDAYAGFPVRSRVKDVKIPVQAMCADADFNLVHHPWYLSNFPDVREVRFAGVHPMHDIERPERDIEYVEVIDRFFKSL